MKNNKIFGLCSARHAMPDCVQEFIFPNEIANPTDTEYLYHLAAQSLKDCESATVYVTGLTVCVGAVVSYCAKNGISLTLMHFDRNTNGYYPQVLF